MKNVSEIMFRWCLTYDAVYSLFKCFYYGALTELVNHYTFDFKKDLNSQLSFTCNYVVSPRRGFLVLLVLGMGCVIVLWHSLILPYNHFTNETN